MTYYESILDDLKAVPANSLIGMSIQHAIAKDDTYVTMDLIAALQSQGQSNPRETRQVLGDKAYNKIMRLCNR